MWSQLSGRVALQKEGGAAYLYASVVQSTSHYLTVQMHTPPPQPALLKTRTPLHVVFEAHPSVRREACVYQCVDNYLILQWRVPLPKLQKRHYARYAYDEILSYRNIHSANILGAWQTAQCVDISQGGLALHLNVTTMLPDCLDLWIRPENSLSASGRVYTDLGVEVQAGAENTPLRLQGRTLLPYRISETVVRCGVMFTNMRQDHENRLQQLLLGLPPIREDGEIPGKIVST